MSDINMRKKIDEERRMLTFEEMLQHKMVKKELSYEEALKDIIRTSTTTNADVNKELGL